MLAGVGSVVRAHGRVVALGVDQWPQTVIPVCEIRTLGEFSRAGKNCFANKRAVGVPVEVGQLCIK